jgi:hypothetical protein
MGHLPESADSHHPTARLPWVERAARALLRGELIGLEEFDGLEQLAVLQVMTELVAAEARRLLVQAPPRPRR